MIEPLIQNQPKFLKILLESIQKVISEYRIEVNRTEIYPISQIGMWHCTPATFIDFLEMMLDKSQNTQAPTIKGILNGILSANGYSVIDNVNSKRVDVVIDLQTFTYSIT